MKKCVSFLLLAFVLGLVNVNASTRWTIQGVVYQVDTLSHYYVGPGTTQTIITLANRTRTEKVFYTTTDLSNPYVTLRAINAHDGIWGVAEEDHMTESTEGNPSGDEVLSKMISHKKGAFVGLNADFFGNLNDRRHYEIVYRFPMYGHVISDGETYNMRVAAAENTFNLRSGNVPVFGRVEYTATVKANGKSAKLNSVNTDRGADYLVLYTNRLNTYNHGTRANDVGSEAYLKVISGSFKSGSTLRLKVESIRKNKGNMAVADANHFVLSGHGAGQNFVDGLAVGNTVEITPTLKINGSTVNDVMQSVGGLPMLLKNGVIQNTENVLNHLTEPDPRSAVGAGNGKVVLLVAEGRVGPDDGNRDGLRSKEVADVLKHLGCTDALNFDGGGSSEMYSKDFGILNRVSDGSEREVYNGLFVATSDPNYVDNNTIASIRFVDWAKTLKSNGTYTPVVYGYNQYGVLINKEVQKSSKFSLECPENLGVISGKSLKVGKYNGIYALTAKYGTASTKIAITVTGGVNPPDPKPDPEPDPEPEPDPDPTPGPEPDPEPLPDQDTYPVNAKTWTIQSTKFNVDTVYHYYIGPGTTRTALDLTAGSRKQRIYYTTTDLADPSVTVRMGMAHDGVFGNAEEEYKGGNENTKANPCGDEVLSKMISHKKGMISGINADFFGAVNERRHPEIWYHTPFYGHAISDGEPYYIRPDAAENTFALTSDNKPVYGKAEYSAKVTVNGKSKNLSSVNTDRGADFMTLYTPRMNTYGHGTRTNKYGTEVKLRIDNAPLKTGTTTKLTATEKQVGGDGTDFGNMKVTDNTYVLSGHGAGDTFLQGISVNDKVTITPTLKIDGRTTNNVTQMVGGMPMILRRGEILNTQNALSHLTEKHPRSTVGSSARKTRLVMLVADGRNMGGSSGLTSKELADIMKHLGCYDAINFDGGGSSEMYDVNYGIVNKPSDGSERELINGLFVATADPSYVDNQTIASIRFMDYAKTVDYNGSYTPVVYGYNKYGVLINKEVQKSSNFSLECPAELGTIVGKTFKATGYGTHALTAKYGTAKATLVVTINGGTPPGPGPDPDPDPTPGPDVDPEDPAVPTIWNIQSVKFNVDTVSHFYVGPGTTRTILDLRAEDGRKQRIYYTTTDLTNPDVTIKMGMAGDGIFGVEGTEANPCGDEVLSKIIKHKSEMISGINADFFGAQNERRHPEIWYHTPYYGHAISDGEPYYIRPDAAENTFCFTADKKPLFGRAEYTATVEVNGQTTNLTSVNTRRDSHYLTLYTNRLNTYHHGTRSNEWGTEVKLTIDNQPLTPGKTTVLTATEKVSAKGNMFVDDANTYVLSGNGNGETFAKKISVGDKVKVTPTLKVDGREVNNVAQMVGGMPMILRRGEILNTQNALSHLTEKHPRSTVGSSANGNKVVMLVADGRNLGGSSGLTSKELADIMKHIGCDDAMNFDGGGSSEMYDINYGIINKPSDGNERQVINGLFVAAAKPEYMNDKTIAQIRFKDHSKIVKIEEQYTPEILGYNAHGVLVSATPLTGFTLSCPSSVGYVKNGNTFVGTTNVYFGLTANYKGLTAKLPVLVSNVATGAELNSEDRQISVFASDGVIYVSGIDVARLNVVAMSGELVACGEEDIMDISNLADGIYIVQVFDTDGEIHVAKICKN